MKERESASRPRATSRWPQLAPLGHQLTQRRAHGASTFIQTRTGLPADPLEALRGEGGGPTFSLASLNSLRLLARQADNPGEYFAML